MKMGHWAFTLVLVLFLALGHTAAGLSLREQLALAEKDEDTYAQIELIRRILEQEPRDTALRARLADLWLSIDDLEMAESIVRDWQQAPAALRAKVKPVVEKYSNEFGEASAKEMIGELEKIRGKAK